MSLLGGLVLNGASRSMLQSDVEPFRDTEYENLIHGLRMISLGHFSGSTQLEASNRVLNTA